VAAKTATKQAAAAAGNTKYAQSGAPWWKQYL